MTGGFGPSLGPIPQDSSQRWTGHAHVLGPRWTHLPVLTIGLLGVQIFWSVEMSYASPYLLSLGLTTSHVALVFLAGPLSGLLVQPLVGAFADTNTSRWGRRRPYILIGCLICVAGMLLLGYTRAIAGVVFENGGHAHGVLTVILAVLAIFLIDFSINAVQAVDRALLVDTLPPAQQAAGNACAALMLGVGSVVGFFVGNLPLVTLLPFLRAESELQALSVIVSFLLLASHGLTAALVRERVLLKTAGAPRPSLRHEVREIWTHARALPRVIRQIFFAWLGWFPVLFYTTMYITDVYFQDESILSTTPLSPSVALPPTDADAPTRLGARAQLLSALLALASNALLPLIIPSPPSSSSWWRLRIPDAARVPLPTLWAASHLVFAGCMVGSFFTHSVAGATFLIACTGFSWGVTQWAPFSLLAEAILTAPAPSSDAAGQSMSMSIRLADARTPAQTEEEEAFLVSRPGEDSDSENEGSGEEMEFVRPPHSRHDSYHEDASVDASVSESGYGDGYREDEEDEADEDDDGMYPPPPRNGNKNAALLLGNPAAQLSVVDVLTPRSNWGDDGRFEPDAGGAGEGLMSPTSPGDVEHGERGEAQGGGLSAKAGVILGIHNIFIVIPQFLVTGLSAAIFAVFDGTLLLIRFHSPADRTFFTSRIGAIWASVAFVLAWRLARELRRL
ncbi:MFS general substrate transporter [Mycena vitilis]|nr:MFS general substrate transporter [Mycena vitilis]